MKKFLIILTFGAILLLTAGVLFYFIFQKSGQKPEEKSMPPTSFPKTLEESLEALTAPAATVIKTPEPVSEELLKKVSAPSAGAPEMTQQDLDKILQQLTAPEK